MNCCDRHADILPEGCCQGRLCPERRCLGGDNYHGPLPSAEEASGWLYIAAVCFALVVVTCFLGYALSTLELPDLAFLIR